MKALEGVPTGQCVAAPSRCPMIGQIVNARTLYGSPVQGLLIHVGPRCLGPEPKAPVAVLLGTKSRVGEVYICQPITLSRPPTIGVRLVMP